MTENSLMRFISRGPALPNIFNMLFKLNTTAYIKCISGLYKVEIIYNNDHYRDLFWVILQHVLEFIKFESPL